MFQLTDKIAVITGGASGIGKAIAELFGKQGAQIHIIDLSDEAARQAANAISSSGGRAYAYACNIASQTDTIAIVDKIVKDAGRIDILVNCAGISHIGKLENTTEADFDRLFNVNVKGVYNAMLAAIPHMKRQNAGVILNMASVASFIGLADRFAYSMTKGAVATMTLSVAKDYLPNNIRCNSISPARVHTAFVDGYLKANYPGREQEMYDKLAKTQPIGRMGKPHEVAALALYLCSDEAAFVTGTDYPIDGGFLKLNT